MRTRLHDIVAEKTGPEAARPAVTFKDRSATYADLWLEAQAFAGGLAGLGLRRGDRVGIYLDKRIETVAAILGTSAADGVFVPINTLLRGRQVGYIMADCDVRVLVTTRTSHGRMADDLANLPALEHVVLLDGLPDDGAALPYAVHAWDDVRGDAAPAQAGVDIDMAAILYTSGSTGKPKGVVLSHRNLVSGAESVSSYLANHADDVILSVLPLSFDAGFSQLTTAFNAGAHVVLCNYVLPSEVVTLCARHRVTGLTCVPPLWIQLVEQSWPEEATRSLRYFANTGGRMPRATLDRLRSTFTGAAPYLMYGLTEAFRSTYLDPAEVDRRPDSIGKAIPNAEILVVGPDGTECAPGEEGELVHRGALVALGYWGDAARTAERFRPAPSQHAGLTTELAVWSGDLVTRDEEGFLYFVGRADDMIKTSGYRVSPTEVEEVVYATGIARDAVALGVDDDRLGQQIVLVVSPPEGSDLDPDALLAVLRSELPRYMVPARVEVRDSLPRSANGKFDRTVLRAQVTGTEVKA